MKLSEAIIKGCEGTYQIRGTFTNYRGGYCAIGAAKRAYGIADNDMGQRITGELRAYVYLRARHPETGEVRGVHSICTDLNDCYNWPRLSIAEWVANVVEPEFERGR